MHGCQIVFGSSRSASSCSLPCWGSLQACCSVPRPCGRGIPAAAGKKVLAPTRLTTLPRDIKVRRGFRCRGKKQLSTLSHSICPRYYPSAFLPHSFSSRQDREG